LAAAKAKEADAETKKKAAENELKRKESELEIAHKKYEDACERCRIARQEVAVATAERDQAQSEVNHLRMTLESWQDAYDHHFVPLRDGPGVPKADSHLAALRPLFQLWGEPYEFEECLLGGFYPSAHETPDQRHSWCKKVVAEVDRLWREPMRVKKAELTKAEMFLVEKQKILDRCLEVEDRVCNREVAAAEKEVQRCTEAVIKAREVLAAAEVVWQQAESYREQCQHELDMAEQDLKRFLDYWAAYQWLMSERSDFVEYHQPVVQYVQMAQPAVHTVQKAQEVYTSSPYRKRSFSPVQTAREVYTSSPYGKRSDFVRSATESASIAQTAREAYTQAAEKLSHSSQAAFGERSDFVQTAQEPDWKERWSQSLMGSRASLTGRTGTSFTHDVNRREY
jgi:hypothetical protein